MQVRHLEFMYDKSMSCVKLYEHMDNKSGRMNILIPNENCTFKIDYRSAKQIGKKFCLDLETVLQFGVIYSRNHRMSTKSILAEHHDGTGVFNLL